MDSEKLRIFEDAGFFFGRMISGSKSYYANKFPDHEVVFNARIYDMEMYEKEKNGKIKDFFEGQGIEIWYGDLDLTRDIEKLKEIANKIGTFVITTESGKYVSTIKKGEIK
jgi:hypothetical protein